MTKTMMMMIVMLTLLCFFFGKVSSTYPCDLCPLCNARQQYDRDLVAIAPYLRRTLGFARIAVDCDRETETLSLPAVKTDK